MSKKLIYGFEGREIIRRGTNVVADAVAPTLGAQGKAVLIDCGGLSPVLADDGGTILRHLLFKNRELELINKYIQKLGLKMHNKSGDGRSTAVTLMRSFTEAALDEIGHDGHKIDDVKARLDKGLVDTLAMLSEYKREVRPEDLEGIATIASLDAEAGKVIAAAFNAVGKDGDVKTEESSTIGLSLEIVKGFRFDKGLVTHHFFTDREKEVCALEAPYVLVTDRRIATNYQISSWLEKIVDSQSVDVLVVALDIEGEALASLVSNHARKAMHIACVSAPFSGQRQKDFLNDIAIATGATIISEEAGLKLDDVSLKLLGRAEKIEVNLEETVIINGTGDKVVIDQRVASLKETMDKKEAEFEKSIIRSRIAAFGAGVAMIRIGALSDYEFKKRRDKIDDAIHSTKLALDEGVVPGGGAPFAKIAYRIEDPIFRKALTAPFERMALNAGIFDNVGWLGRLFNVEPTVYDALYDVQENGEETEGYNFRTKRFVDLIEDKVIDPFKVERIALESAISFVREVITTDEVMLEEDFPRTNE